MTDESSAVEAHWQRVYGTKDPTRATWYQEVPRYSIDLIERTGVDPISPIIDAGGGASPLVDHLIERGYTDLTVLDVSSAALGHARDRLGERASGVDWICEDVTAMIPDRRYAVWHDRAVFHFLTDPVDRALYAAVLYEAVEPGGWVIIGTFAPDGPDACSGLRCCRYGGEDLAVELGGGFELVEERRELHRSPDGVEQRFAWSVFRRPDGA